MKTDLVGKVFKTKKHGDCVITQYVKYNDVTVKFLDTGYVVKTALNHVKSGFIKDKLAPSLHGVGIVGDFSKEDMLSKQPEYILWCNMLTRCYSVRYHNNNPSYKDCTVSDNFKYYPYFKEWCNNQLGYNVKEFALDKDILVKGNKAYSEDTCCFVPSAINNLFVKSNSSRGDLPIGVSFDKDSQKYRPHLSMNGKVSHLKRVDTVEEAFSMYKHLKEGHIKDIAEKYKGQIDKRVYQALLNYKVEITD